MYNTDPITTLTNQPETGAIPPLTLSRGAGCLEVGANVVFDEYQPAKVDELEIFVFGSVVDGGAKLAEMEEAMTRVVGCWAESWRRLNLLRIGWPT